MSQIPCMTCEIWDRNCWVRDTFVLTRTSRQLNGNQLLKRRSDFGDRSARVKWLSLTRQTPMGVWVLALSSDRCCFDPGTWANIINRLHPGAPAQPRIMSLGLTQVQRRGKILIEDVASGHQLPDSLLGTTLNAIGASQPESWAGAGLGSLWIWPLDQTLRLHTTSFHTLMLIFDCYLNILCLIRDWPCLSR